MKIPKHNIQSNSFVRNKAELRAAGILKKKQLTSRTCTPSACTATVTWSSELDFWETVAYTPGFLSKLLPRIVDVYVARRKGSPIFDLLIAYEINCLSLISCRPDFQTTWKCNLITWSESYKSYISSEFGLFLLSRRATKKGVSTETTEGALIVIDKNSFKFHFNKIVNFATCRLRRSLIFLTN